MDHAPIPRGGGSTDDQCALRKTGIKGATQRCPTSRAVCIRVLGEEEPIQISQESKGSIAESFLHGGSESKESLTRAAVRTFHCQLSYPPDTPY